MRGSKHTPEQRKAWLELRRVKPEWRLFYGWHFVPIYRKSDIVITDAKPEIVGYRKQFSHQPGAILSGAPRGARREGKWYIVWEDQSLREITRRTFEMLAKVPAIARVPMLQGKKTLKKAA